MIFVYLLKFNLPRCDDPGNSNVARLSFWLIAWLLRWISTSASSRTFGCSRTFVGFILVHKTCEIWFTDKWSHGPILALMTYNSPPDIQPDPLLFHVPSWIKFLFEVDALPSEVAIFKKKNRKSLRRDTASRVCSHRSRLACNNFEPQKFRSISCWVGRNQVIFCHWCLFNHIICSYYGALFNLGILGHSNENGLDSVFGRARESRKDQFWDPGILKRIWLYLVGSVGTGGRMTGIDHQDTGKWTMNEEGWKCTLQRPSKPGEH